MNKRIGVFAVFFIVTLSLFLVTSLTYAKGKGRGGSNPSGWDKGEKKGWHSDVPPGIEKKGSQSVEENASEEKPIVEEEVEKEEEGTGKVIRETEDADESSKEKGREKAQEKAKKKEKHQKGDRGKKRNSS